MSPWLLPTIIVIIAAVIGAGAFVFLDSDFADFLGFVAGLLLGVAALWFFVCGCIAFAGHQSEVSCERYGEASERVVKFERYRFTDWECLVRTDDGWIARSGLYVDEGPGR